MAVIEKNGFTNLFDLLYSLSKDLQSLGMKKLLEEFDTNTKSLQISFEASDAIDSFWSVTKVKTWRLSLVLDKYGMIHVYVSTSRYILNSGKISKELLVKNGEDTYKIGKLDFAPGLIRGFWINEYDTSQTQLTEYTTGDSTKPITYIVVTSDHGLFINLVEENSDTFQNRVTTGSLAHLSPKSSWFLVQRPLTTSGDVYISGKSPVVCIFNRCETYRNQGDNYFFNKQYPTIFIVNEYDVQRPDIQYRCDIPNPTGLMLNTSTIVNHNEDRSICLNIPRGFSTSRYYYPLDIDMLATCSADVVAEKQLIKVVKYKNKNSTYQGLKSNGLDNTKTRFLVCINSPGSVNNIISV